MLSKVKVKGNYPKWGLLLRWVTSCLQQSSGVLTGLLLLENTTWKDNPSFNRAKWPHQRHLSSLEHLLLTSEDKSEDHPAVAFWIFYLWIYSKRIFQGSDREYILFSLTLGMQKHNKHLPVNSITIFCIILFCLFCSWKYSKSLFLQGCSGLGFNDVLDSSMSNSFESHLFCLGTLVTGLTVFQLNCENQTRVCSKTPGFGKFNVRHDFLKIRHVLRTIQVARTVDTCYVDSRQL